MIIIFKKGLMSKVYFGISLRYILIDSYTRSLIANRIIILKRYNDSPELFVFADVRVINANYELERKNSFPIIKWQNL